MGVSSPSAFGTTLLVATSESLLAEREVSRRVAAASAERPRAAVVRVAAGDLTPGGLAEATGGSLFADATIVVITNLPELPPEVADPLVAIAADPGPDLALVLVHPGGMKGKAVLDRLRKVAGKVADPPALKPRELPQFVADEVRAGGGRIDRQAAEALVDAVGTDLHALASAVRQLLADAEETVLTADAVRRYFGGRAEVRGYEIANGALAGRTGEALERLRWGLETGIGPPVVTAALAGSLREVGKYLDARDAGLRDQQIAERIGVPAWKLRSLGPLARDWQPAGVARAIAAVAVADAQIKGASSDAGFALERLVLAVVGCRGRR